MLLAEARAMNEMEHERIIPLLGFVEDSASIVMEYMEHGSLKVFIKNNQNMQWKLRHILLLDIAEGMEYLHSKTTADGQPKAILFHQDLKTDNVLLGIEYGELRAKISDFGFACTTKESRTKYI